MFKPIFPYCSVLLLLALGLARGGDIYVPDDFSTIQGAINAAANGDSVIVRPGTYLEKIVFYGKAISVTSESGPSATMIDGDHTGIVASFEYGEGNSTELEGFTIANGRECGIYCWQSSPTLSNNVVIRTRFGTESGLYNLEGSHPVVTECYFIANPGYGIYNQGNSNPVVTDCELSNNGGGMRNEANSNPQVSRCTFNDNSSMSGMANWSSHPTVDSCTFTDNYASINGGGIYNREDSRPIVTNCTFVGNRAGSVGGGIGNGYESNNTATVTDCTFIRNSASNGGGVANGSDGNDSTLINCLFIENTASGHGGGFSGSESDPQLIGCTFIGNTAGRNGGGLSCSGDIVLINCTFSGNSAENGGGISHSSGHSNLDSCTFTGNSAVLNGGGIFNASGGSLTVANSILWNDSPDEIFDESPSSTTATFSCIEGGWTGTGNIDADPLFADPADDCHLTWDSPCRNSGDNTAVVSTEDFEGDPRIADGTVDMGADEFHLHLYCIQDVVPGGSIEVKVVGTPGTTPVTLGMGSGVQDPPQSTPYGLLHLVPPIRQFPLGTIPSNGVLVASSTVPGSWSSGEQFPFQALAGLELSNLMVLTVE